MGLSRVMTAIVARTLADLEEAVTVPQLRILVMLYFDGRTNLATIARNLGVDRSNASRPADRLVAAGFVRRDEDERDRRNVVLSLTARGRRLVDSMMDRRREIFGDLIARLDPEDRVALARGVRALLAHVESEPQDPLAGLATTVPEPLLPWVL